MLCGGTSAARPATNETQQMADEVRGPRRLGGGVPGDSGRSVPGLWVRACGCLAGLPSPAGPSPGGRRLSVGACPPG